MFRFVEECLIDSLVLSLIPMVVIAAIAGMISILQAITQVQEQSISHAARVIAIALVLVFGGQRGFRELERLFVEIVTRLGESNFP